ncbi:MAG TPA: GNAT family N-acetyltransferase [Jatrophihabitantaceae bacterium]
MTGETVTFRRATKSDIDPIAQLWFDGWRDGHLGNVPDELLPLRTRESFDGRTADALDSTLVAEVEGDVAGFVMVVGDEVEQVYVAAAHRGTGVAGALLVEAERLVREGGHARAWLAVVPGNARARRFYERSGWRDEGLFDYPASVERGTLPVPCHRYVKDV